MMLYGPAISENGSLKFDSIDASYRTFLVDLLRVHGVDPDRFCRPVPRSDEMLFKAVLPNYEGDLSIAAFKFVEAAMRRGEAYRQIVLSCFGSFDALSSVLDFASGYGR